MTVESFADSWRRQRIPNQCADIGLEFFDGASFQQVIQHFFSLVLFTCVFVMLTIQQCLNRFTICILLRTKLDICFKLIEMEVIKTPIDEENYVQMFMGQLTPSQIATINGQVESCVSLLHAEHL